MRVLVIGGTSFVGRTIVGDALGQGHEVTTFNRGLTGKDIDGVEALRGDRSTDEGVRPLAGRAAGLIAVSGVMAAMPDPAGFVGGGWFGVLGYQLGRGFSWSAGITRWSPTNPRCPASSSRPPAHPPAC